MRDIFDDIFGNDPRDPVESARRNMRPDLRRRFYRTTGVERAGEGYRVVLDGRAVKTPARRELAAPARELAQAIAAEWDAQKDTIDPARMPVTRLANSIIDGVADNMAAVAADIEKYLGSDLVFYRAGEPDGLVQAQQQHWDPVLAWAREELGARFVLAQGVVYAAQPPEAVAAMRKAVPRDPWALGAVHSATTITGSALLALALALGRIDRDAAWAAANVDEDWNMQTWGRDEIALERRAERFRDFSAAAGMLGCLRRES